MQLHADVNDQAPDDALDHRRGDLRGGETHDLPAGEKRFEVLLGVRNEASGAVMSALDVDTAFDFDQRAALDVCEVRAPFALGVKAKFAFEFRPAK